MSDLESMVTGLSDSINGYLKQNQQQQRGQQNMAVQQQLSQQTHQVDAQTDQDMAGKVTPDMAEKEVPGAGAWVTGFQQQNKRLPTLNEAQTFMSGIVNYQKNQDDGSDAAKQQKTQASQLTNYQKMYNSDGVIKAEKLASSAADTAMDQVHLAVSNPVAYSSVPITLARMLTGSSRINVQEINRLGGSQAIVDKANQIGTQMGSGTITPDNANWMEDVVNTLKTAHQTNIENRGVELSSQYRQLSKDKLPDAYQKITGQPIPQRFMQTPTQTATGSNINQADAKKAALRLKLGLIQ